MESVADEAEATTTSHFRGPSTEAEGSEVTVQGKDTLFMSNDSLSCLSPLNLCYFCYFVKGLACVERDVQSCSL